MKETCSLSQDVVLQVESITKMYGSHRALSDISFSIPRGQATALIGQNGAGKTTLVETILNLRRADRGRVAIMGLDVEKHPEIVSRVGVQLQDANMFPMVSLQRYFTFFSRLYNAPMPSSSLLHSLGLEGYLKKNFTDLSGGLKQRALLAMALINDPELLILDEPSTGLDPFARESLWSFIESWLLNKNHTLFLTSHFMDEVERLCERVIVLAESRIVADKPLCTLLTQEDGRLSSLHNAYRRLVEPVHG